MSKRERRPTSLSVLPFEPANQPPPGWLDEYDPRANELHAALRDILPHLTPLMRAVVTMLYYEDLSLRKTALALYRRGHTKQLLDVKQVARLRDYVLRHLRVRLAEWAGASRDEYTLARMRQAEVKGVRFDEVVRGNGRAGRDRMEEGDGRV